MEMHDAFDEKRQMVKHLLDMLKSSAATEVSDGLKPKGLEVEKVSVIPHDGDMSPEAASRMAEGGMASDSDEPEEMHASDAEARMKGVDGSASEEAIKNLSGPVKDEEAEAEDSQNMSNARLMDDDQDNNQSAFNAFLPRKKKK